MKVYTAPEPIELLPGHLKVFLAGTIDNGNSEDWQQTLINKYKKDDRALFVTVFNPRRKDWNPEASIEELEEQILWELNALDNSDLIIFNFLPDSKSPITFLELGLQLGKSPDKRPNLIVICPEKFYRYHNVKVTCEKKGIQIYHSLEEYFNLI